MGVGAIYGSIRNASSFDLKAPEFMTFVGMALDVLRHLARMTATVHKEGH
jgi:hypothetical protein